MSAERMPQAESSLLADPLRRITAWVVRFPRVVLALAVCAAVVSVLFGISSLGFRTNRLDLIDPDTTYNQLWIEYIHEFGEANDVVVVVESSRREQVVPVLEEISAVLTRKQRLFRAVLHEVDLSKVRAKGLYYLPAEELSAIEGFLHGAEPVAKGDWTRLKVGNMAHAMGARLNDPAVDRDPARRASLHAELDSLGQSLLAALGTQGYYQSPWPEMPTLVTPLGELNSQYLMTNEGRMGFVLLRLAEDENDNQESFTHGSHAIDALRGLIEQIQGDHPETTIGLTGLPVMENDEMRSSQASMATASLLSLFGVACLFVAGFGGLRHPLITVGALLLALAWSLGYITLAVGHLNILSVSFGVILIGLGIDFGVHYAARYLQVRREVASSADALTETAGSVGPGIVTGTITTAIAFLMAGFTEFTGIAELGIIAGGGIILCCVAAIVVLPAMLQLLDANRQDQRSPAMLDIHGWMKPLFARPSLVLLVTGAGTLALALGMANFFEEGWYDHNLLNLQAEGLQSVQLERKLLTESDQSVWFALSIADSREELLARKARFSQLPSVERVEEIVSLIPVNDAAKQTIIARIHRRLEGFPEQPPQIPVDRPDDLERILAEIQLRVGNGPQVGNDPRSARIDWQLGQVRESLRRMSPSEYYQRLSDYQHYMARDLLSRLHAIGPMANPEPPQWSDLPQGLVTRFVGQNGEKHLLKIYSQGDIWDMDAMEQFVREVRSVDSRVTGNPLQTYEASRQMQRSYIQAAWYALAAIVVVLYLDFRSICHTLLAMTPLALGMLQMFGLLGLLKVPLNPANMIVLPLILGIGIDDGVHVVHDFRRSQGRYRMSAATASAVLITSLTTMVGFGSLMIANHQGLQSLGRVLTIGVSCCLFTSLIMLPAMLIWFTWNRPDVAEKEEEIFDEPANGPAPHYSPKDSRPASRRAYIHPAHRNPHRR